MTTTTALGSKGLAVHELLELSSSSNVLYAFFTLRVQFYGIHEIASSKQRVYPLKLKSVLPGGWYNQCRIHPVMCGVVHGVIETSYRQYLRVLDLVQRSPEALCLVEEVVEEAVPLI